MANIETEIEELISNEKKLKKLFLLEKERRKAEINRPIFIGISNIAAYKWCSIKSVLKSMEEELKFFMAYLHDRLLYSYRLNLIKRLPEDENAILEIGDDITFKEIEELLDEDVKFFKKSETRYSIASETMVTKNDKKITIINPNLSPLSKKFFEEVAKSEGSIIISLEEAPAKTRGEIIEDSMAEKYPTIRWNFTWKDYVIIGIPDGILDDSIYKFKTTKNRFLFNFIKPVAFSQADLYGYFFRRKKKKIQIFIMEEEKIESFENEVDEKNALDILNKFSLASENKKFVSPKEWKCKTCEFNNKCPIYKKR